MRDITRSLILTLLLVLFAALPAAMAMPMTVANIPWLIFVYGIPALAVLIIVGVFIWHLAGGGE